MKVLHVISRMNSGGTATYLNTLLPGLSKKGVEVLLVIGNVASGESESIGISNSYIRRIDSLNRSLNISNDLSSISDFKEIVKDFKPDVVHSHAFKGGLISRVNPVKGPSRVHTFHGHHLHDPEFGRIEIGIMNMIERFLQRKTDGYMFVGNRVKTELQAVGIGRNRPSTVIAPGVELGALPSKSEALKNLGLGEISKDQVVIMWSGRFVDVKRPERVLELAEGLPHQIFVMAGDGPLKAELAQRAPSNLHLVGWQDRDSILAAADLFLSTSQSEGMPLSLIEAQCAGIPVFAPDVGSVSELIMNEESGYLCDPSLEDLESKVEKLASDSKLRMKMSQVSRNLGKEKFSVDGFVMNHLIFYESILNRSNN